MDALLPPPWRVCLLTGDGNSLPTAYQGLLTHKEVHPTIRSTSQLQESELDQFHMIYPLEPPAFLWGTSRPLPAALRWVGPTLDLYRQMISAFPLDKAEETDNHFIVDAFAQKERGVIFALARQQRRHKNGLRFDPVPTVDAMGFARLVYDATSLTGAFSFHLSLAGTTLAPYAVSPFLEDSTLFTHMAGPNLPLLSLYAAAGFPIDVPLWQSPAPMLGAAHGYVLEDPSFSALYVDFDETLILRKAVNAPLLSLIKQARKEGLPVTLLTKHPGDLERQLAAYDLAKHFTEICHLPPCPHIGKGPFITADDALFFEDSYAEKKRVREHNSSVRCLDACLAPCFLKQ